ncbi:MAG: hypothetical protein ACRBHB_10515 [Arenicella sp.]
MKVSIFFAYALIVVFLTQYSHAGERVYTATVKDEAIVKTNEFSCTDSIYIFVESSGDSDKRPASAHVQWKDPSGTLVRTGKHNFKPVNASNSYLWDGLKFTPGGDLFSNIAMLLLDPAEGLGDVIGNWEVTVQLTAKQIYTQSFTVVC